MTSNDWDSRESEPNLEVLRRLAPPKVVKKPGPHLGLVWEATTLGDIDEIVALHNGSGPNEIIGENMSSKALADFLELNCIGENSLTGRDSAGTLQAFASVVLNSKAVTELQADLYAIVSQQWQGRGIGRALLEWQVGLARTLLAADGRDLPASIRSITDSHNLDRRRLLTAGGFSSNLSKVMLVRSLDDHSWEGTDQSGFHCNHGPSTSGFADFGLEARPLDPSDEVQVEALRRLNNRLVLSRRGLQPVSRERLDKMLAHSEPELSTMLYDGDALVGYAICIDPVTATNAVVRLYGVERALRNRGIGSALIRSVMCKARSHGKRNIVVPVVNDSSRRSGFLAHEGFLEGSIYMTYAIDL